MNSRILQLAIYLKILEPYSRGMSRMRYGAMHFEMYKNRIIKLIKNLLSFNFIK